MNVASLMSAFEWIGTVLTLVAAIYLCLIARVTGWFKAWSILAVAFFLIVIRRIISTIASTVTFADYKPLLLQINSVILLLLGIMYVISFYMLYNLFKRKFSSRKGGN